LTVDLRGKQQWTVKDFSGGLNEHASSYQVANNELVAVNNMTLRDSGAIKTRLGEEKYFSQGVTVDTIANLPVRGAHRYQPGSGGTKKILFYSGTGVGTPLVETTGKLFELDIDDDITKIPTKIDSILSNDEYLRFAQYKNTLMYSTDREGPKTYQNTGSASVRISSSSRIEIFAFNELATATGGLEAGDAWRYRYTFDRMHGTGSFSDLLSESDLVGGEQVISGVLRKYYAENWVTLASTGSIQLKKFGISLPSDVVAINVYRSATPKPKPSPSTGVENFDDEPNMFYLGSISRTDYNAANDGDVVFEDDGTIPPGRQIREGILEKPPAARFLEFHKNRMFYAYVDYNVFDGSAGGLQVTSQHRLMWSQFGARGTEIEAVLPISWIDVDPRDGEGITGLKSFNNELLYIFKANSIWVLLGGNTQITENVPDFHFRNVTHSVGCIAPETITEVEGVLTFLSHSGIYAMNGVNEPRPLKTRNINKKLQAIPNTKKYQAASGFHSSERELWVAHTHQDAGGVYNKLVSKFSLDNSSWTRAEQKFPVSGFLELKSLNEQPIFLGTIEDVATNLLTEPSILKMDSSFTESQDLAGTTDPIPFSFQTKFFDLDRPYMDKNFIAILFTLKAQTDLTLDVLCDNRLDTRTDAGGSFTIQVASPLTGDLVWNVGNWNEKNWGGVDERTRLVKLDDRCWGKRISLIPSGTSDTESVEIQQITFFYVPKPGVRE